MKISNSDFIRYSKQIILKKIGIKGQKKIATAKVLIIGAGGLGCPMLLYLANSGIRYSDQMTIEGGGMEIPISSLSGVTDKSSLLTMCYGHLKTGELSGGIDV